MDRRRLAPQMSGSSIATFAVVFLVYALGAWIPLPGLDAEKLASMTSFSLDPSMARFSIFSLGLVPLFTVLAHAEIAKLLFPRLVRWQEASCRNASRWNDVLRISTLVLTAMQGYGIMVGLRAVGVVDDTDAIAVPVGLATFVGSTALLIWLVDRLRLPGLGNGFWFLWLAPLVGALPATFLQQVDLIRTGGMAPSMMLFGLVYALVAALLAVTATLIVIQAPKTDEASQARQKNRAETQRILAAVIWPPFLASIAAGYLILLYPLVWPAQGGDLSGAIAVSHIVATALLLPLFSYLYGRQRTDIHGAVSDARDDESTRLLFRYGLAGLLQSALCAGIGLLVWIYPVFGSWSGAQLIAVVAVTMSLASCWRSGSGSPPPGAVVPVALRTTGSAPSAG